MKLVVFLSYILYCFYIGVLLLFLPWTPLWDSNGLLAMFPALGSLVLSGPVRGSISGLGVVLLGLGAVDAVRFIRFGGHEED